MGNISVATPILGICIVIIIAILKHGCGIRFKRLSHSKKERDMALQEFAESLLNARDESKFILDLCHRYEIAIVNSSLHRLSSYSTTWKTIESTYDPQQRLQLKNTFLDKFLDNSHSRIIYKIIKELELLSLIKVENDNNRMKLFNNVNDNDDPTVTGMNKNPMISTDKPTIEFKDLRESKLSITDPVIEETPVGKVPDMELILLLNKINSKFTEHVISQLGQRIILTPNVKTYNDWFSSLRAINMK